jgi:D-3-phosphoglycerate dehydrogenase
MAKKYVLLDAQALFDADTGIEEKLLGEQKIECIKAECKTTEDVIRAAADADAVGLVYVQMNDKVMDHLKNCEVMVRYGIGYDSIDVPAATRHGIAVCNLPDYCQPEVATHTFALVLDCCRKVSLLDRSIRKKIWNGNLGYRMHRLSTLTLGLVGFGSIARLFVQYIKPMVKEIIAYDPYLQADAMTKQGCRKVSLDDLWANADIVSVHTPLTEETRHLVNKDSFAKMKKGVIIVNTARGPIVNLEDLAAALKSEKVIAAGLDTIEGEPNVDLAHPIFSCDNVVFTPHNAYNSIEAEKEQHEKVAKSVIEVLNGRIPYNCVNKKDLQK